MKMIKFICTFILLSVVLYPSLSSAEFVISYRSADSENDNRQAYGIDALTLLMEKTVGEFGPYRLIPTPAMNSARALFALSVNAYPNYVAEITYTDKIIEEHSLDYIPIPIDFGIVGYRVCFVNPEKKQEIAQTKSLDELKNYTIGQGAGWPDTDILKHNGFKVIEQPNYDSLFKWVAAGRIDLFCRGANELPFEFKAFSQIKNLAYDQSFVLVYPLPRFLFFQRNATELRNRLELGLKKAMEDGSLKKLWLKNFMRNLEFVQLNKRKIYYLENPTIKNLDPQYRKYNLDPFKLF